MSDDQTSPAESPQTPVSDGLASAPVEQASEPTPEAVLSEPAEPVSKTAPEAAAAESQIEGETPEPEPTPRTQGAASAASAPAASAKFPEHDRELLKIARAKIQTNKQQSLEKIMTLLEKKEKIVE